MTVHVERARSEVVGEPEPSGAGEAAETDWDEIERFRAARERVARDVQRTRAEGYDD